MRGTETKMDLEFGIYKQSTRRARHKWVMAIPHDVIRDFLGVGRLHRTNEVYFHHWTAPRGSDVLVCFSLSRSKERLSWSPRGAAALKLTVIGNGPFGICNPSLRRVDGVTGFIPVPDRYESSRRSVSATAERNDGNAVYSFPLPAGWSSPPLVDVRDEARGSIVTRSASGPIVKKAEVAPPTTRTIVGDPNGRSPSELLVDRAEALGDNVRRASAGRDELNRALDADPLLSAYVRDDGRVGLRRRADVEL